MQVAAIHQIEDEAELVGRVERVRHTNDERTVRLQSINNHYVNNNNHNIKALQLPFAQLYIQVYQFW